MKNLIFRTNFFFTMLVVLLFSTRTYAQTAPVMEYENKGIIPGDYGGDTICLNNWVPPQSGNTIGNSSPGVCNGVEISALALTAISSKNSSDKLEQIRVLLEQLNNNLTKVVSENRRLNKDHDRRENVALRELIDEKFDALPVEVVANKQIKEILNKLRQDLLESIKKEVDESQK